MKKQTVTFYVAMLLISLLIIKTSCKDKSTTGYSSKPPNKRTIYDTTRFIGVFPTPERDNIVHDIVYRIRMDSVQTEVDMGNGTFKKLWGVDTFYYLPKAVPIIDTATKKALLDSAGKPKFRVDYVGPYAKEFVWDSGINVDSAQQRFKKYLLAAVDTTRKK